MKVLPMILIAGAATVAVLALATDARFADADRDGDGRLSLVEPMQEIPNLSAEAFEAADADESGALSEAEFVAAVEKGVLPRG